jgi:hypothetical protein
MNDTQRYVVYHANDMLEIHLPPAMRWYADQSMYYTHVADVVAPLEQIFLLTNHIDHPWTDNPEVIWLATSRIRSTSVGDIIVSSESGQAWLVMPVGLQELPVLQGMHPGHAQTTEASHTMQHALHAPFGLSQVANYEEVSRRYISDRPDLALEAPLPPALPTRHPLLAQLEGRYAVQDHLPPWWEGCVEVLTAACPCLNPLLSPLSQEEFRRGSVDQQRWKAWRISKVPGKSTPWPCCVPRTSPKASCIRLICLIWASRHRQRRWSKNENLHRCRSRQSRRSGYHVTCWATGMSLAQTSRASWVTSMPCVYCSCTGTRSILSGPMCGLWHSGNEVSKAN